MISKTIGFRGVPYFQTHPNRKTNEPSMIWGSHILRHLQVEKGTPPFRKGPRTKDQGFLWGFRRKQWLDMWILYSNYMD